ncbi:MAG: hypothetical protein SGI83_15250 [Bacteroidota bacterium]|nr:hypothetical protein [Bacteroidota bacterium]
MEDFEKEEVFSWSNLFLITAGCSFLFNIGIKILDGSFSYLLMIIGFVATGLGALNWLARMLSKQLNKKRKKRRFAS